MQSFSTLCVAVLAMSAFVSAQYTDPGLPTPNPTKPGWFYNAYNEYDPQFQNYATSASFANSITYDYTVIGGGWSGVSTAYFLAKLGSASKNILLLDARGIANGASGRNLGWMAAKSFVHFQASVNANGGGAVGLRRALDEVTFERQVAADVLQLLSDTNNLLYAETVPPPFGGRYLIYRDAQEFATATSDLAAFRSNTSYNDVTAIPASKCNALFQISDSLGCFFISSHYRLRTPIAVWALFNKLIEFPNVHVYTNNAVTSVKKVGSNYDIFLNGGKTKTFTSVNVVYAMNAYVSHLLPGLQNGRNANFIYPAGQQIIQTQPFTKVVPAAFLADVEFADDEYGLWQRLNGAYIVAQGFEYLNSNDSANDPAQTADAVNFAQTELPADPRAYADHVWTGIQGFSNDHQPYVGSLQNTTSPRLWISAGFNGHGNPRAYGCGRALAQQILGLTVSPALPEVYKTTYRGAAFFNTVLVGMV